MRVPFQFSELQKWIVEKSTTQQLSKSKKRFILVQVDMLILQDIQMKKDAKDLEIVIINGLHL